MAWTIGVATRGILGWNEATTAGVLFTLPFVVLTVLGFAYFGEQLFASIEVDEHSLTRRSPWVKPKVVPLDAGTVVYEFYGEGEPSLYVRSGEDLMLIPNNLQDIEHLMEMLKRQPQIEYKPHKTYAWKEIHGRKHPRSKR